MSFGSLSMNTFSGSPGDMPSGAMGNSFGSGDISSGNTIGSGSSMGRGAYNLSSQTQSLLKEADNLIAKYAQQCGVALQQGTGSHGDRVVNAARVHSKLASMDPQLAESFLKEMAKIGQPLGLNFGLRMPSGEALNADASGKLSGNARTEHDKLLSQWDQDRASRGGGGGTGSGSGNGGGSSPMRGGNTGNMSNSQLRPDGGSSMRAQPNQGGSPSSAALDKLLTSVAALNRNGDSNKIGLEEVQRALQSQGLGQGEKQALLLLGQKIQQQGGKPLSMQEAKQLLSSSSSASSSGRGNGLGGAGPMRQQPQANWPDIRGMQVNDFMRTLNGDRNSGQITLAEMRNALSNPNLPQAGRPLLQQLMGMTNRPADTDSMRSFLKSLQEFQQAQAGMGW
jgi:hypothetical protein